MRFEPALVYTYTLVVKSNFLSIVYPISNHQLCEASHSVNCFALYVYMNGNEISGASLTFFCSVFVDYVRLLCLYCSNRLYSR